MQLHGLSNESVLENRVRYGENRITPPSRTPWWKLYLEKFNDPVIRILIVAACLSIVIGVIEGKFIEGIGIILAILLATGISFFNEHKASREFDLLNKVNDDTPVKVIRNGQYTEIPKHAVVVGDYVAIETGEEAPADGEIIQSVSLEMNESKLTGESVAVKKYCKDNQNLAKAESAYPPYKILSQTTVSAGHGIILITAVGDQTETATTIRSAMEETPHDTPLTKQLEKLSKFIGRIGFATAGLVFLLLVLRGILGHQLGLSYDTFHWLLSYFMIAVTIIVVAVPEGLPMSVTLSLAYSMRKMMSENNLVRKMDACETIGAVTTICTDKTGTLTENKMKIVEAHFTTEISPLIAEAISINSTANLNLETKSVIGNPTEGALLSWLNDQSLNYQSYRADFKILEQHPFSTDKKYMATFGKSAVLPTPVIYMKGAPEIVLAHCSEKNRTDIDQLLTSYQKRGFRTLGFAYAPITDETDQIEASTLKNLTWMGFVVISDPLRAEVPRAIEICQKAGIQIKIITGDHVLMATEIGRQLGLITPENESLPGTVLTGPELNAMDEPDLIKILKNIRVVSRAKPLDKLRIIKALKAQNEVVAVTGDGTNDAPALNFADVGLSMGKTGTSVAKEASDIILLDDSFASIVTGILWGRGLYQNIQRFLVFQLTINFAALALALIGPFMGIALPFTVTQMLWINLIMDTFAAFALATEPPNPGVMTHSPRKSNAFIITRAMFREIIGFGLLFVVVLAGLLWKIKSISDPAQLNYALTVFFATFVMLQFWNMLNARVLFSNKSAFKSLWKQKPFLLIITIIFVMQIVFTQIGGEIFRTVPLRFKDWVFIITSTSLVLWIGEIKRLLGKR